MIYPERIPATNPNRVFPIGDIDDFRVHTAHRWIDKKENIDDRKKRAAKLVSDVADTSRQCLDGEANLKTHKSAIKLCDTWDARANPTSHFARNGYFLARTLSVLVHVIPVKYGDFSQELEQMEADPLRAAEEFGVDAWENMRLSHRKLFGVYNHLNDLAIGVLGTNSPEDDRLQ